MHQISAIFLVLLLFLCTGCEKKRDKHAAIFVENTTQVLSEVPHSAVHNDTQKALIHNNISSDTTKNMLLLKDTFTLTDTKNRHFTVTLSGQDISIKESTKPIVMVTFFASWCPPCVHEIPYLNDLHKKYSKDLLLAAVLVHDAMDTSAVKSFVAKHLIDYYVSNGTQNNDFASLTAKTLHLSRNFPIPLSVIYVNGRYFTHYEGIVPVEMIEYDIEEALKTLK